ncbi:MULTISPECIES: hypothetical protein [unclassified Xanthobacter]|uniref:hypothetical protein n=1 Tax=unclassified Xanthobacter TaxID=2623496 RepID=UPI001F1841AF|nr:MULTISPECIES: hypothetical protein [unclassified Xanthobacter]
MSYEEPGLRHDIWVERALLLSGALAPVVGALERAGIVGSGGMSQEALFHPDRLDNLVRFFCIDRDGEFIDLLGSGAPQVIRELQLPVIFGGLTQFMSNLPGHLLAAPAKPVPVDPASEGAFVAAARWAHRDENDVRSWASGRAAEVAGLPGIATGDVACFRSARAAMYEQYGYAVGHALRWGAPLVLFPDKQGETTGRERLAAALGVFGSLGAITDAWSKIEVQMAAGAREGTAMVGGTALAWRQSEPAEVI